MFHSAERVLLEFGGLIVNQQGPGETCAREPFEIDPTLAGYEGDRFNELSTEVNTKLYPLGEVANGTSFWAIGDNEHVYILMNEILLLGKNIDEALERLIIGRESKALQRGRAMCKKWIIVLAVLVLSANVASAQAPSTRTDCSMHLEKARTYEMFGDVRAVAEFQAAIKGDSSRCSDALLELSQSLSRSLRFSDAFRTLNDYIVSTPKLDHKEDIKELTALQTAADLKQRVETAAEPTLTDLIALTKLCNVYGRGKARDALPYAEKAVSLYANSVSALLLNAEILLPVHLDDNRVLLLLNQAANIDSADARIFSTRGWFYLFTLNDRERSEKDFREALCLSHDADSLAWKGLGHVLMLTGRKVESLAALKKYLLINKEDAEAIALVKRLENPR